MQQPTCQKPLFNPKLNIVIVNKYQLTSLHIYSCKSVTDLINTVWNYG